MPTEEAIESVLYLSRPIDAGKNIALCFSMERLERFSGLTSDEIEDTINFVCTYYPSVSYNKGERLCLIPKKKSLLSPLTKKLKERRRKNKNLDT